MIKSEKRKQFFEYFRGKGTPKAQDILNAAAVAGNITEIIPEILDYARAMGIDAAVELADLIKSQDTARQAAGVRETAASLAKKSGALAAENDPEKQRELIQAIRKDTASLEPASGGGFQFVRADTLEAKPPSWLVRGLIETDSFGCLYGDPAAGKSFIGIELALCVASGTPFYGLEVKQGPVIYLAGEGQSGLARRFKAWSIARGVSLDRKPLYINRGTVSLIDGNSMVYVIQVLDRLILELGRPPALAILDTWSRVLGGDDSAPSDAAAGVAALDDLRARFGNFAALVVHHEGHTKGRGRGWSGLRAAVDVELRAEKGNDGVVRLECTKAKDAEPIEPMAFHFAEVNLGFDDDKGNEVTSAVLAPSVWTPAPEATPQKSAGKNQAIVLEILEQLKKTHGDKIAVSVWSKECRDAGITKQRFYDARISLEKSGTIRIHDDLVLCLVTVPGPGPVTVPPLLYSGGDRTVTGNHGQVTERTKTLPSVTVTKSTLPVATFTPPELFQAERPAYEQEKHAGGPGFGRMLELPQSP